MKWMSGVDNIHLQYKFYMEPQLMIWFKKKKKYIYLASVNDIYIYIYNITDNVNII